MDLEQVGM
jgi:hypothetical protein